MGAVAVRFELVLIDLAAQRIAVNSKNLGGTGLVAVGAVQDALDETLFEFAYCLVKQNPALDHLIDEPFQLIFHDGTLRSRNYGVRARLASPVRAQPGCDRLPGTWREWLRRLQEEAPGRAGFLATASSRDSREQTVCQKKPVGRRGCSGRRTKSEKNRA